MSKYLRISIDADGIATLTLDNPDGPVNVVSPAWLEEMRTAFESLKADQAVRGIIIASAKKAFLAGLDLKLMLECCRQMGETDAFEMSQNGTRLHRLIETCGKPVVAALCGHALGGGYELALACHLRILTDDPEATVGLPEVKFGLLPGSGGTQRLPRMIGAEKALEVLLEGKAYRPAEALALGLVDAVVPDERVFAAAKAWLTQSPDPVRAWDKKGFNAPDAGGLLNRKSAAFFNIATAKLHAQFGSNYPAPIAILSCVFEGLQVPLDTALRIEGRRFASVVTSAVSRNLIRTNFINRRKAQKGICRPPGIDKGTQRRVGVLGAGLMGAGIAFAAASVGIETILLDVSLEAAERGKASTAKLLEKDVLRGRVSRGDAAAVLDRIKPTADYADLTGVPFVVEAVFESTAIKADVTRKAQAVMARDGIFASNTSTLPITQLAGAFERPTDFIGLHFFSPVHRMELVEVIKGLKTSPTTLAKALDFVMQLTKTPIVVNDSRGFYTSRVFQTFLNEGMALLQEGVVPALIENGAKHAGFPAGPLALLDEVSLELPREIVRQYEKEDVAYRRPASVQVLEVMIERLGRRGRRAGKGFYDYPSDGAKRLWRGLAEVFPRAKLQPPEGEVIERLLNIQALESVRCLEQGVLTNPADADLGAVLGWSFPRWTGGTISLIETVGVRRFVDDCVRLARAHGERFTPPRTLHELIRRDIGFYA